MSIGIDCSVVLNLVEKAVKSSQLIGRSKLKNVFDRVKIFSSAGMVIYQTPFSPQADLAFTLFSEGSPSCSKRFLIGLAFFFKHVDKMTKNKLGKLFRIYFTIFPCCNYTLSICNCYHKVSIFFSCALLTSSPRETRIKFSPQLLGIWLGQKDYYVNVL